MSLLLRRVAALPPLSDAGTSSFILSEPTATINTGTALTLAQAVAIARETQLVLASSVSLNIGTSLALAETFVAIGIIDAGPTTVALLTSGTSGLGATLADSFFVSTTATVELADARGTALQLQAEGVGGIGTSGATIFALLLEETHTVNDTVFAAGETALALDGSVAFEVADYAAMPGGTLEGEAYLLVNPPKPKPLYRYLTERIELRMELLDCHLELDLDFENQLIEDDIFAAVALLV